MAAKAETEISCVDVSTPVEKFQVVGLGSNGHLRKHCALEAFDKIAEQFPIKPS